MANPSNWYLPLWARNLHRGMTLSWSSVFHSMTDDQLKFVLRCRFLAQTGKDQVEGFAVQRTNLNLMGKFHNWLIDYCGYSCSKKSQVWCRSLKKGCLHCLLTSFVLLFYVSFLCRFLLSMVNPPTWSLPVWARNLHCGTTLSWSSVLLRTTVSSFTTGTEATQTGTLWLSF